MVFIKQIKKLRRRLIALLYTKGVKFSSYDFSIGKGSILKADSSSTIIFHGNINIECYVILRSIENGNIEIGKNVFIGDYSTIRATKNSSVKIGNDTMISQNVKIVSTNHAFTKKNRLIKEQDIIEEKKGVIIGNDCWLGSACIILPGVTIGNGVVIGANTVITKNVPDYAVIVGNPGKIVKYRT